MARQDYSEQVIQLTIELIKYLRSFDDEDKERGLIAANNIERSLSTLEYDYFKNRDNLSYSIGLKGMLDWKWSSSHCKRLEKYSNDIHRLMYTA
jgi:hypothetical protein